MEPPKCKRCGKEYVKKKWAQMYCGKECGKTYISNRTIKEKPQSNKRGFRG